MGLYTRIPDRERVLIPDEIRCEISYNGYHTWEIVKEEIQSTPIFVCTKLKIVEAKTLTSGKHLKLKVSDPDSKQWINVNAWRKGYLAEYLKEGSLIDLAFTMSIDDWQGRKSLTLTTVDIKPHVK